MIPRRLSPSFDPSHSRTQKSPVTPRPSDCDNGDLYGSDTQDSPHHEPAPDGGFPEPIPLRVDCVQGFAVLNHDEERHWQQLDTQAQIDRLMRGAEQRILSKFFGQPYAAPGHAGPAPDQHGDQQAKASPDASTAQRTGRAQTPADTRSPSPSPEPREPFNDKLWG